MADAASSAGGAAPLTVKDVQNEIHNYIKLHLKGDIVTRSKGKYDKDCYLVLKLDGHEFFRKLIEW